MFCCECLVNNPSVYSVLQHRLSILLHFNPTCSFSSGASVRGIVTASHREEDFAVIFAPVRLASCGVEETECENCADESRIEPDISEQYVDDIHRALFDSVWSRRTSIPPIVVRVDIAHDGSLKQCWEIWLLRRYILST